MSRKYLLLAACLLSLSVLAFPRVWFSALALVTGDIDAMIIVLRYWWLIAVLVIAPPLMLAMVSIRAYFADKPNAGGER